MENEPMTSKEYANSLSPKTLAAPTQLFNGGHYGPRIEKQRRRIAKAFLTNETTPAEMDFIREEVKQEGITIDEFRRRVVLTELQCSLQDISEVIQTALRFQDTIDIARPINLKIIDDLAQALTAFRTRSL